MSAVIITDTHFGDGGSRDDYIQRPELMDRWLLMCATLRDMQEADPDLLVILTGDLFNGEYGPRVCIDGSTFREGMRHLRPLNPIICVGNHDSEIHTFKDHAIFAGCTIRDTLIVDGTLYMHGHQVDPFNGRFGWIGRKVSKAAGLIGMLNPDWEDALRAGGGRDSDNRAFAKCAVEYARKRGCTRVVCGHTHEAPVQTATYCNAGMWQRDGYMAIK